MSKLKFLAVGDLHLRKSSPAMRTDDFFATLERKLDFIFETGHEHNCSAIIFPGDIFDRHDAPHGLVEWAIRKFRASNHLCLFVYGQHDLRYHTSDKQNSPLGVLIAAMESKARVLTPDNAFITYDPPSGITAVIRGCSWGEAIPEFPLIEGLGKHAEDAVNILVLHRPIINSPVPWDHDDMLTTDQLFDSCNADVFVCGDNHQQFVKMTGEGRLIVNMGSVLRTTTAQIEHKPALCLIRLPIEDWYDQKEIIIPHRRKIFDTEAVEAKEEQNEKIAAFLEGLSKEFDAELSFKENLRLAAEETPKGVQDILQEAMG